MVRSLDFFFQAPPVQCETVKRVLRLLMFKRDLRSTLSSNFISSCTLLLLGLGNSDCVLSIQKGFYSCSNDKSDNVFSLLVSVPRVQVKRRPSATGLLLRTHSAGPASQTCLLRLLRRELTTRRNPR